jgi:predicted acetyltransferase
MGNHLMELVWPDAHYLPGYVHALQQGWSPDNLRPQTALQHLARIETDPNRFLREQVDREAKGPPIQLPDNSTVPRLPGYTLWMWDGEFCGSIGLRWQPGTTELPPHCLGHVGYSVVPWKRRRGYATRALQLLLPYARAGRTSVRRVDDRRRQCGVSPCDRIERRHAGEPVPQTGRIRRPREPPLSYRSVVLVFVNSGLHRATAHHFHARCGCCLKGFCCVSRTIAALWRG